MEKKYRARRFDPNKKSSMRMDAKKNTPQHGNIALERRL